MVKWSDFQSFENWKIIPVTNIQSSCFGYNSSLRCQIWVPFVEMETRHSQLSFGIKDTFWFLSSEPNHSFKNCCPVSFVTGRQIMNCDLMLTYELVIDRFWKWFLWENIKLWVYFLTPPTTLNSELNWVIYDRNSKLTLWTKTVFWTDLKLTMVWDLLSEAS